MKKASDAILRPEQAAYLDGLNRLGVNALAALAAAAGATGAHGPDPLLVKMEVRAAERGYPISDPEVVCFLAVLARACRPKLVVEVGTNIGYGAIVLARAAGAESRVKTIEYNPDLVKEARGFIAEAGLTERVEVIEGSAIPELERMQGPIDMVYVDCVKEEYEQYLSLVVPKLSPRGVVVADNVLWGGTVAQASPPASEQRRVDALRAFNRALVTRPDLCGVVLPLGDGVGLATHV
jgi:predicted O-methyltransferase YrrM